MQRHSEPRSSSDVEQLAREMFRHEEAWLDASLGSCVFRDPLLSDQLGDAILHFQGERYLVSSFVIMPNHCHLTIQPFSGWDLETILKGIKGVVAREVNAQSGRCGALWQQKSYDRIVRDEEHLWRVVQYIGRNPFKAKLPCDQWRRWMNPEWESLGWRFADEFATMP
jgi:REP element-mobilizing transposase RayT